MKKIDKAYWQKILQSPIEAKKALVGLTMPNGARVKFVDLEDGRRVAVNEATEDQAYQFMVSLCPKWAKQ
jgi:hypothetical protein